MNKHKFFVLGISLSLLAVSCRKQDVVSDKASPEVMLSEWKAMNNWSALKEDKYTSYNNSITDNALTVDVIENGLVLVYMKAGTHIESLPFQQKGKTDAYWYYQVSENTIQLNAYVYSAAAISNQQAFRYFIINADKLKSLEENGHSQSELMSLNYENAAALLK